MVWGGPDYVSHFWAMKPLSRNKGWKSCPLLSRPCSSRFWNLGVRGFASRPRWTGSSSLVSRRKGPYRNPKIVAGRLSLEKPSIVPTPLQAVPALLGLHTQESISDLESKNQGPYRAQEDVRAITSRLHPQMLKLIRELKDFDQYPHPRSQCLDPLLFPSDQAPGNG